jgi:Ca2+-binding EF-hand superfamily protein
MIDTNQNGIIEKDELKQMLVILGEEPTEKNINDLMVAIDTDENGEISYDEFKEAMAGWWVVCNPTSGND